MSIWQHETMSRKNTEGVTRVAYCDLLGYKEGPATVMQIKRRLTIMQKGFVLVLSTCLLAGCKTTYVDTPGTPNELREIESLTKDKVLEKKKQHTQNMIRINAVRDTAMSYGARSGLAWRAKQINQQLDEKADYLDKIFNFRALMLDEKIMPPVLLEGRSTLNIETPHSIRIADRSYKIAKQARFTTTPPIWRDYLVISASKPETPDATLLPKTDEEEAMWRKQVKTGWEYGVEQANETYIENLSRLKRDYQGMIRYRQLLAQNMVSAPQVGHRDLGVTGGGDQMSINDRVLTIKALPALKADTNQWTPAVAK